MREVRFSLVPPETTPAKVTNSWAGWPAADVVAPYLVLRAIVSGPVHEPTGFLCNISEIDRLIRDRAIPVLRQHYVEAAGRPAPVAMLPGLVWGHVAKALPDDVNLEELHLLTTPHLVISACAGDLPMIRMTQSFEFSASHRLHCPDLSDDENRRVFGKCNNPGGHGHNYVVDVTVEGEPNPQTGVLVRLSDLEATVKEGIIDPLDHKHLDDCPEFRSLNPTVENITRVIWDKLAGRFTGCRLCRVRVWETPKTYAEYDGS